MCVTIPTRALTHAGVFHADDVFAAALLRTLNPGIAIVRSNVVPEGYEGLVFDVGGGEFDHHRGNIRYRDNGVPYSSFGLLWERFGSLLLREEDDVRRFDEELVQPIDLADNSGEQNPLSLCVSDFNPAPPASPDAYDGSFNDAVAWAGGVIRRRLASLRAERSDFDAVRRLAEEGDSRILVLDQVRRWKSALVGSGYGYVVYPSLRGGYNVQCVPERLGTEAWCGPFRKHGAARTSPRSGDFRASLTPPFVIRRVSCARQGALTARGTWQSVPWCPDGSGRTPGLRQTTNEESLRGEWP